VIQKKVCLLGGFGVGKTSLVSRFVHSVFSDKYLTTVGVKIDKKSLAVGSEQVDLILWDIHGDDEFQKVPVSYLRGAAGYLLVVDGTRRSTLDTALNLRSAAERAIGAVPFVMLINKSDLADTWEVDDRVLGRLGWPVLRTSARTGAAVDDAFMTLAQSMLTAR
jgi:small GTP-binding protein